MSKTQQPEALRTRCVEPVGERTPKDYAIEHAEYMAQDAERLLEAIKHLNAQRDEDGEAFDSDALAHAEEAVTEAFGAVRNGIYEFRKRRDRAAAQPAGAQQPTTQPAPQQEALRLAKYVARRKLAKQLDANEIHGFDSGCDTEAVLLLSDIEAVLAQVAALTAAQPAVDALAEAEYFIDNPSAWSNFDQRASDAIAAVCKALRAARAPADSVLEDAARLTYEQAHAIRQGHEISASDGYFEARPQIDSNDRRKVFQAGFERGWDIALKQGANHD